MKRILPFSFVVLVLLSCSFITAHAVEAPSAPDISVAITSPNQIEGKPVYSTDIEITIKNLTDHEIKNLVCYLMIVDVGREQTYPVDEFGSQAYQTRKIESLPAHSEYTVTIPVKITYVGLFKFSASVMDMEKNCIVTADPLTVHMIATSELNKPLVMTVAAIIPLAVAGLVIVLFRRRRRTEKK